MSAVTQRERVLAALRKAGKRGVTQVDFLLPGVCDGGPPITRVGARVHELIGEGREVVKAGRRDKCRVYRLVESAVHHDRVLVVDRDLDQPPALFDDAVGAGRPRSPYEVVE